ncbi:MAG: tRNA (N6-isopentenyl adenosine(37)-C2)-methylthiotransferase MiaB [Thermoanaerobaculia bacterium]
MEKTFFIETWGCQMNDLDTQRVAGQLRLHGYRRVEHAGSASLILLNTCSIREKSEHKVHTRIGELREEKQRGARIGVLGCVAQQEGEKLLERSPHLDFVVGTGNIGNLAPVLEGSTRVALDFPEERNYDWMSIERPSAVRAQVTIVEGCNKNCTFCIVPTARGREISRTLDQIVREADHAVASGRTEIELLGQTVNAYRCPATDADFAGLLDAVATRAGVLRVRFMTSHPAEVTESMIHSMARHANVCRFIHLPVQSGSSAVLRRMKRLYTRERYVETVARFREAIPSIVFSTDIIVGFPGETEGDFAQTLDLLEEIRFGSLFAFKYSPRPGTPSLKLPAEVDDGIASERLNRVLAVQERIQREVLAGYVGRTVPVLYDGPSRNDASMLSGKSEDNWTVNFHGDAALPLGSIVPVMIEETRHYSLRGTVAS